ncbi:sensor domain-containing phosphodiesterase [Pseudoalteromonas sp. T1lg65]|uniref:sensor domain-containing phosphodiesterase n=1 Tax=Pseudoalteromonas sp. T1lg65 TaxID=2077101 RepID=UPI003F793980
MTDYSPAPLPSFEQERLKELTELGILDTQPEARFDRLIEFISALLNVPIALISLIDDERQWFKSACGIDAKETPRDISFCGHTILEQSIFIVEDTLKDPRFAKNPLVTENPNIRFYAGAVLRGPSGQPIGSCCVIDSKPRTLSEQEQQYLLQTAKIIESQIKHDYEVKKIYQAAVSTAYYDPLTGLPNKPLLLDRLKQLISAYSEQDLVFVCAVDICRFSDLNTAKGKEFGDKVLEIVAKRLNRIVDESFTVARLESDKFAVLAFEAESSPFEASLYKSLPPAISAAFDRPLIINNQKLHINVRVGVACSPHDSNLAPVLLEQALMCKKLCANNSHSCVIYHSDATDENPSRRYELEQELRLTLGSDAFSLVYQPIINAQTKELVCLEALLRWRTPRLGNVRPDEFISVAEDTGLIIQLGNWVLDQACKQAKAWLGLREKAPIPITINLASLQLMQPNLVSTISELLAAHQLPANCIQLEVTESSILSDIDNAISNMRKVSELGVNFLLDDFGTGYSSLSYLRKLPTKKLKLDKSFITDIVEDQDAAILVHGIISLCNCLEVDVVAEGVETNKQLELLELFGCDLIQGYLFSKPLSAQEISTRFAAGQFIFTPHETES